MYPTPILWFEIAIAALIGVSFLCSKVEYALFLYGLALGFPDCAFPLGTTINIRVDDVLILFFLARMVLWSPTPPTSKQKKIFLWQGFFLAVCLLSIAMETARGNPPAGYEEAKLFGCVAIFIVLPQIVQSERRLRFLLGGLMCGGVALVIQVHQHLGENSANNFANFQQLKSAATFDTWNPNTIGQAAVLLVFAASLCGMVFPKTMISRILWPMLAMGFALVPVSLFVRGTSLSIAAGIFVFLFLTRQRKWLLVFVLVSLCAVGYLHSRDGRLVQGATAVNLETGEGFSDRFERWKMALRAIQSEPLFGQGFGQELAYLTQIGSEGRAHDAYLTVWLELGVGGLFLMLSAIFQFARAGWSLYGNPRFLYQGALILALTIALSLDSLALSTLNWEKLPTIALSLAIAVVGLCERSEREIAVGETRSSALDVYSQWSKFPHFF
jgi:O-antigen ligase